MVWKFPRSGSKPGPKGARLGRGSIYKGLHTCKKHICYLTDTILNHHSEGSVLLATCDFPLYRIIPVSEENHVMKACRRFKSKGAHILDFDTRWRCSVLWLLVVPFALVPTGGVICSGTHWITGEWSPQPVEIWTRNLLLKIYNESSLVNLIFGNINPVQIKRGLMTTC